MPRFFLNYRSHDGTLLEDADGHHLADLDTARHEAVLACREIMANAIRQGRNPFDGSLLEIADERGDVLQVVTFACAINGVASTGPETRAVPLPILAGSSDRALL